MNKKYYFIDKEIYFMNQKMPDRKVELLNVHIGDDIVTGHDCDYNFYQINKSEIIIEEE